MKKENSRFDRLVAKWNGAFWDDPKTSALALRIGIPCWNALAVSNPTGK